MPIWLTTPPPRGEWIVACRTIPVDWRNRADLPPVVVRWDGWFFADEDGGTHDIAKWYPIPQPEAS